MADTLINGVKVPFLPARGIDGLKEGTPSGVPADGAFEKLFQAELKALKFSRHAQERLESRRIKLNDSDISNLQQAVDRAEEKGAQDSLVLLRDLAFIVSVKNRTVVTAMDGEHLRNNVFTNIDSAVIAA
jgi:flagellar operon protein